jgi:uncharacterized membrane protein SpoIIM required for sporulation
MASIWDRISDYPEFYGAIAVLAVSLPLLLLLIRSQVAKRHETGLLVGMGVAAGPGSMVLMLGFLYGIVFSIKFALGMIVLLAPLVVVPALLGGLVGVAVSWLFRLKRSARGRLADPNA